MLESGLTGKTCLITGGSTGIGLGISRALAREGVHLAVASRNPDPQAMEELKKLSEGHAVAISADVSSEEGAVRMVQEAINHFGRLDLYVNNSAGTWHQPITRITSEAFYKTINTNLTACVWASREVARHMISRRSGSILNVNSTVRFCPAYRESSYRISKMGLKMFVETLAIELAPFGIRVNLLTPGHFPTRLTSRIPAHIEAKLKAEIPLRRFGNPDECGAAAVLLLSDHLSGYTTGADIVVDGGLALRPLPMCTDEEIVKMNLPNDDPSRAGN
jgi:NAD(P)-dependent dehydrogenase (short-subunit alcohol dehydrogenase family)